MLVGGKTVISGMEANRTAKTIAIDILVGRGINPVTTGVCMISNFDNAAKIMAGRFCTIGDASFGELFFQGFNFYPWEGLQILSGYNFTRLRSAFGDISRVDFLGGATYVTSENSGS